MRRTIPTERRPTHPGEMLREEFMPDYGLSVSKLAELIGVSRQTINELINERRSMSPDMACRLAKLFGDDPESWLNLQMNVDLWEAYNNKKEDLEQIQRLSA